MGVGITKARTVSDDDKVRALIILTSKMVILLKRRH